MASTLTLQRVSLVWITPVFSNVEERWHSNDFVIAMIYIFKIFDDQFPSDPHHICTSGDARRGSPHALKGIILRIPIKRYEKLIENNPCEGWLIIKEGV